MVKLLRDGLGGLLPVGDVFADLLELYELCTWVFHSELGIGYEAEAFFKERFECEVVW